MQGGVATAILLVWHLLIVVNKSLDDRQRSSPLKAKQKGRRLMTSILARFLGMFDNSMQNVSPINSHVILHIKQPSDFPGEELCW